MNKPSKHNVSKPSVGHHMLRALYSLVFTLLLPLLVVVFRRKLYQRHDKLVGRRFSERFGSLPSHFKPKGIHIHCVSVGELNAAKGLILQLLSEAKHLPITLTTSSITGALHAKNLFDDRVQHAYLPIDIPLFMRRFYAKLQPKLVIVTEVEIWPNMVHQSSRQGAALVLINARMTARSLRSYQRFSWLFRRTLRQFNEICAQSSESFENFIAFGIYKKHLTLSRNMKFDLLPDSRDQELGIRIEHFFGLDSKKVVVAASTHDPEEKMMLESFRLLKKEFPNLVLIIVPRHPHRFDSVYQIFKASGFTTLKISDYPQVTDLRISQADTSSMALPSDEVIDCIVVDAMGCLKAAYSLCDTAFIGGSFADKGGHNALEGALYAKPMVMGPSTFNNPVICQHLANENALVIADTPEEMTTSLAYWLNNKQHAVLDGERGSKVLFRNTGAIECTMSVLRPYLQHD